MLQVYLINRHMLYFTVTIDLLASALEKNRITCFELECEQLFKNNIV